MTTRHSLVLLLAIALPTAALAAPASDAPPADAKARTAAAPAKPGTSPAGTEKEKGKDGELVTNVVGSQEAPTVLNVVPWKDKEVKLEKKSPTTAILNQVLQPLDRDVLRREVQYFRSLQDQKTQ